MLSGGGGGGMASIRRALLSPAAVAVAHQQQRPPILPTAATTIQTQQRQRPTDHHHRWGRGDHRHHLTPKSSNSNAATSLLRLLGFFLLLGFLLGLLLLHFQLEIDDDHADPSPLRPSSSTSNSIPAPPLPKLLLVVTPTYPRALQAYYLTRLAHTLRLVPPPLLWIVVETGSPDPHTAHLLRTARVLYRHLICSNTSSSSSAQFKDRGVHQRNAALHHIELHRLDGIVYFADDDNIYSLELFHRIRGIARFGTWPVAMLAQGKNKATLEGPVCNGSAVIGWHTNEKSKRLRRFHVDMSGFAFNSTILWDPKSWRRPTADRIRQLDTVKEGFQETTFIEQLVEDESQMEGIPHGCSRIMNWHLHLEAKDLVYPRGWQISRNLDINVPLQ